MSTFLFVCVLCLNMFLKWSFNVLVTFIALKVEEKATQSPTCQTMPYPYCDPLCLHFVTNCFLNAILLTFLMPSHDCKTPACWLNTLSLSSPRGQKLFYQLTLPQQPWELWTPARWRHGYREFSTVVGPSTVQISAETLQ